MLRKREERGEPAPALHEKVELTEDVLWIVAAWRILSSRRSWDGSSGMPQPVQLQSIESYCRLFEIQDAIDIEELVSCMVAMDMAFMDVNVRRISSKIPKKK